MDVLFARLSRGKRVEEVFEWITGYFLPLLHSLNTSSFLPVTPVSSSSSLVCQGDGWNASLDKL